MSRKWHCDRIRRPVPGTSHAREQKRSLIADRGNGCGSLIRTTGSCPEQVTATTDSKSGAKIGPMLQTSESTLWASAIPKIIAEPGASGPIRPISAGRRQGCGFLMMPHWPGFELQCFIDPNLSPMFMLCSAREEVKTRQKE